MMNMKVLTLSHTDNDSRCHSKNMILLTKDESSIKQNEITICFPILLYVLICFYNEHKPNHSAFESVQSPLSTKNSKHAIIISTNLCKTRQCRKQRVSKVGSLQKKEKKRVKHTRIYKKGPSKETSSASPVHKIQSNLVHLGEVHGHSLWLGRIWLDSPSDTPPLFSIPVTNKFQERKHIDINNE